MSADLSRRSGRDEGFGAARNANQFERADAETIGIGASVTTLWVRASLGRLAVGSMIHWLDGGAGFGAATNIGDGVCRAVSETSTVPVIPASNAIPSAIRVGIEALPPVHQSAKRRVRPRVGACALAVPLADTGGRQSRTSTLHFGG